MAYARRKRIKWSRTPVNRINRYAPRFLGAASGAALGYIRGNIPGAIAGAGSGWAAGKQYSKRNRLTKRDYRKKLGSNSRTRFRSNNNQTGSNPGHVFGSNPSRGKAQTPTVRTRRFSNIGGPAKSKKYRKRF